jgi:hypothetical protein
MPVSSLGVANSESTLAPNQARKAGPNHLRELLLCTPLLIFIQFLAWVAFLPGALRGHADFRQLYAAGYLVRTGHSHQLYDYRLQRQVQDSLVSDDERALPFIRPAYQALLFVPFSIVPYRTAYLAFLFVNFGLLTLCFVLLRDNLANLRNEWWGLPPVLFLAFYPIALAIMQGQDSILLLACLCAALVCSQRGCEFWAGLFLGLGLFKLQIVVPIALLFLLWRRRKFVAGFATMAATLSAISIATTGWSQTLVFIQSLLSVGASASPTDLIKFPLRVTLMANLRGLVAGVLAEQLPAAWIQTVTIIITILLVIWVAMRLARNADREKMFLVAIIAGVLVSYYLFIHDLAVLLIPIVLTLNRFILGQTSDVDSALAKWSAALMLVAPMLVFLVPGHFYLLSLLVFVFLLILVRAWHLEVVAAEDGRGTRPA